MTRMVPIDGAKVREARTAAELSQAALAAKAGISRSYVSDIERGKLPEVSQEVRAALGEALGLVWEEPVPEFEVTDAGRGALAGRRRIRGRLRAAR